MTSAHVYKGVKIKH